MGARGEISGPIGGIVRNSILSFLLRLYLKSSLIYAGLIGLMQEFHFKCVNFCVDYEQQLCFGRNVCRGYGHQKQFAGFASQEPIVRGLSGVKVVSLAASLRAIISSDFRRETSV